MPERLNFEKARSQVINFMKRDPYLLESKDRIIEKAIADFDVETLPDTRSRINF